MPSEASGEYLRNAVMTAQPEQLQMMLFDGALRFGRQAREALVAGRLDESCEKIIRAERIVAEMWNGLRPEVNPELCDQMARLYDFVYHRMVEANLRQDVHLLDEALTILEKLRETWALLLERIHTESPASTSADAPGAESLTTLCVEG